MGLWKCSFTIWPRDKSHGTTWCSWWKWTLLGLHGCICMWLLHHKMSGLYLCYCVASVSDCCTSNCLSCTCVLCCIDSVPGLAYLTTSTTWWDLIVSWSRGDFQHSFVGLTANSYMICYMVFNNPIKKKVYKIHLVYYLFSIVLSDLVLMQAVLASLTSGYWISYMIWQWSLQMKIVISVWRK